MKKGSGIIVIHRKRLGLAAFLLAVAGICLSMGNHRKPPQRTVAVRVSGQNGEDGAAESQGNSGEKNVLDGVTESQGNDGEKNTSDGVTESQGNDGEKNTSDGAAESQGNGGENMADSAAESQENDGEKNTSDGSAESGEKEYIRWVEFHVTKEALQQAFEYDVATHNQERPLDWIQLLAYLGARYGGDFDRYEPKDMDEAAERITEGGETMEQITEKMEYYSYYLEAYGAVLGGLVGEYEAEEQTEAGTRRVRVYGLKGFHPIAKGFPYSDYDDFGVSRSYGYKRNHLGHDMMGQVGTPVIAVESGYVAALGWNQYGGWRIGINSFDGKRYYYYAHLRQNFPYAKWLEEGSVVQAGDVIGYMGRTGYSAVENVNNIDTSHLHFGLQLIFDESQREGNNQIWIDTYELIRFLYQNQCETARDDETKEWSRVRDISDPAAREWEEEKGESSDPAAEAQE